MIVRGIFQHPVKHLLQCLALLRCQIIHFVLVAERTQPKLPAGAPPVVDDPQSSAFAFSAPLVGKPHLAQSTGVLDDFAGFGIVHQFLLQLPETFVAQVAGTVSAKAGSSTKTAFTYELYATYVYTRVTYRSPPIPIRLSTPGRKAL